MASVAECEKGFARLAERLAAADAATRKNNSFDRSLSCSIPDLEVVFGARLHGGLLTDIKQVDDPAAQIRLRMSSDDLIQMVDGHLHLASAWANGRIKVEAGVFDLMKLRSIF